MAERGTGWLDEALHRASLRRWGGAARGAKAARLSDLRRDQVRARALRQKLDELLATAESRLAFSRIGSEAFAWPDGADWSWRPRLWRLPLDRKGLAGAGNRTPVGEEATLFHDCPLAEIALRQVRNGREGDLAPFALRLEVLRFGGSFLSLAIDLPPEACEGLRRRHLLRLDLSAAAEAPLRLFARLNVRHGPNAEAILRELPLGEASAEFDLAPTEINERRVERMWLDLIFEAPAMNQVTLRDLTFARLPRAEL